MTNPYQASEDATQKPKPFDKSKRDAISLSLAIAFVSVSPLALLAIWIFLPAPSPRGPWGLETINDRILYTVGVAHLILILASLVTIWVYHSETRKRIIVTVVAIASIPAMLVGLALTALEKTNKWL